MFFLLHFQNVAILVYIVSDIRLERPQCIYWYLLVIPEETHPVTRYLAVAAPIPRRRRLPYRLPVSGINVFQDRQSIFFPPPEPLNLPAVVYIPILSVTSLSSTKNCRTEYKNLLHRTEREERGGDKGILWILSCRAKATKTRRKRVAREFVRAPLGLRHRYVSEEGLEPCQCNDMLL